MVWFLLMETETVPMGWAPYEPMMQPRRDWIRGAGLEGAAAFSVFFGLRAQLLRGPCLLWVRVWRSWLCR